MKNLIKKILREENDLDWGWVEDIGPIHDSHNYVIIIDEIMTDSDWQKFVDYTHYLGYNTKNSYFQWDYNEITIPNRSIEENGGVIFYLSKDENDNKEIGWDDLNELDEAIEKGYIPIKLEDFIEIGIENHLKNIKEDKDLEWIKDIEPMSMDESYVVSINGLSIGDYRDFTDDLGDLGYDNLFLPSGHERIPCYVYMEKDGDNSLFTDWNGCDVGDPTYSGKYQMITMEDFNELYDYWKTEKQGDVGE